MIKYKTIKINDANSLEISQLIIKTFSKFNNKEGDKKSVTNFISSISPEASSLEEITKKFKMLPINIGAYYNDKLIGVIRGKKDRIINLFIDESFHGQGIGQKLVKLFEKKAKELDSNMIKIRSSLYASVFYQKQGYKKTTGVRKFHGIKVQPLIKKYKYFKLS